MKNKYVIIGLGAVLTASIALYLVKKREKGSKLSDQSGLSQKTILSGRRFP